jgi:hypothetical protein
VKLETAGNNSEVQDSNIPKYGFGSKNNANISPEPNPWDYKPPAYRDTKQNDL